MIRLITLVCSCILSVTAAQAQVDVGYPNTALGASPFFGLDTPDTDGGDLYFAFGSTYHVKPLIFIAPDGSRTAGIDERLLSIFSTSVRLWSGLHFMAQGRLLTYQSGVGASPNLPLSDEIIVGRTRLGLKYSHTLANKETQIGLQIMLDTPSEREDPLFGGAGYHPSAGLLISHEISSTVLAANLMYQHRPQRTLGTITEAPRLNLQLGVSHRVTTSFSVLFETHYSQHTEDPLEESMRVDAGISFGLTDTLQTKLGGGLGLLQGIGTPQHQLFAALEFIPPSKQGKPAKVSPTVEIATSATPDRKQVASRPVDGQDSDGDGLNNLVDNCPLLAEDFDKYLDHDGCPDPDNDYDGYADSEDRAPFLPEDYDGFEDHDGVPEADNDQDGLSDGVDRCPTQPGLSDGCPESPFNWRDYAARTDRTLPVILRSGDVLHLFRNETEDNHDMMVATTAEWLQTRHEWDRVNVIISHCDDSAQNQTDSAKSLAQRIAKELIELGINRRRVGFLAMSRYRTPKDTCQLSIRIKRLRGFEGLGQSIQDVPQPQQVGNQEQLNIGFVPNRPEPTAETAPLLIEFAQKRISDGRYFELQVHTDNLGEPEQKLELSTQRALKLKELLTHLGVPNSQFRCTGKGGSEPIGNNRTLEGRQMNNRVVVQYGTPSEGL